MAGARVAHAQAAPVLPPPTSVEYVQYGVSLHTLTLLDSGDVCPVNAKTPCIVGSGGGLGLRVGYRTRGPFVELDPKEVEKTLSISAYAGFLVAQSAAKPARARPP